MDKLVRGILNVLTSFEISILNTQRFTYYCHTLLSLSIYTLFIKGVSVAAKQQIQN